LGVERREEPLIALLDHGRGRVVRPHDSQPPDLAVSDHLLDGSDLLVGRGGHPPEREDAASLGRVGVVIPAVVEHALGQPLVRVVLDQLVEEGRGGVGREDRSPLDGTLEAADQRGRVRDGDEFSRFVRQVEGRQQRDLRGGQLRRIGRVLLDEEIGDPAIPQHRPHLAGVGRAGRADHLDGVGKRHVGCPLGEPSTAPLRVNGRRDSATARVGRVG